MLKILSARFFAEVRPGSNGEPVPFGSLHVVDCDHFPAKSIDMHLGVAARLTRTLDNPLSVVEAEMFDAGGKSCSARFRVKYSSDDLEGSDQVDWVFLATVPDVTFRKSGYHYCKLTVDGDMMNEVMIETQLFSKSRA